MLKIFKKNWIHLLLWCSMILFIVYMPMIVDYYKISESASVKIDTELKQFTNLIRVSIDGMNPEKLNRQNFYNIWGWSFISPEKDQSDYEIYLVLRSSQNEYIYLTESISRSDVQEAYKDLDIDLSTSGFSAYIIKEEIHIGTYEIEILYKNKADNTLYYQRTNKKLVRSPNTLKLEKTDFVGIITGKPIVITPKSFDSTGYIQYSIDKLDLYEATESDVFHLWGWSFITTDIDQTKFEIFIGLKSNKYDYYFMTETMERSDVQNAFNNSEIDLINSGFSTYIARNELEIGIYDICIIYRDKFNGDTYFQMTNKKLINNENSLMLELKS